MPETNRIEYKQELNNDVDIEREVIAFLNCHEGGIIYISIDKHGNTVENLSKDFVEKIPIIKQVDEIMNWSGLNVIIDNKEILTIENQLLSEPKELLLSKLATVFN